VSGQSGPAVAGDGVAQATSTECPEVARAQQKVFIRRRLEAFFNSTILPTRGEAEPGQLRTSETSNRGRCGPSDGPGSPKAVRVPVRNHEDPTALR